MKKHIYDRWGMTELRIEERDPVCGVDFCDECGDCLVCYGSDPCWHGGEHFWVEYEGELVRWQLGTQKEDPADD